MGKKKKNKNQAPQKSAPDPLSDDALYNDLPRVPHQPSPAAAARRVPPTVPDGPVASESGESGADIPDYDFTYQPPQEPSVRQVDDEFAGGKTASAIKMAFIGAGQGGGRIAEAFHFMGYRRVCVCNTTPQDMEALNIEHKLVIGNDRGGAGKDPEQGKLAARESFEDVMDLMMRAWGEGVEHVYICVGGGGGCIEESAYIYTLEYGLERFGDLYDRFAAEREECLHDSGASCLVLQSGELHAISWDEDGQRFVERPITRLWRHEVSTEDRVDVHIEGGACVPTSAWHPTAVLRESGLEWVPGEELSPGDSILSGTAATWPGLGRDVSPDAAWFIGALFGNGGLYWDGQSDYAITFKHPDRDVCEAFQRVAAEEFGASVRAITPTPGAFQAACGTRKAVERVKAFAGLEYGPKGQWKVPAWVWRSERHVACAFLAGLFDTDGCASKSRFEVSYSTVSEPASTAIAGLFNLLLGGLARTTVRDPQGYDSPRDRSQEQRTYEVAVRGPDVHEDVADLVAPYMRYFSRRDQIVEQAQRAPSGGAVERVRIPWRLFSSATRSLGFTVVTSSASFGDANVSAWMRGGYPLRSTFSAAMRELEVRARAMLELPDDPVAAITTAERFGRNTVLGRRALARAAGCNELSYDRYLEGGAGTEITCSLNEVITGKVSGLREQAKRVLDQVRLWRSISTTLATVVDVQPSARTGRMLDCTVEGTENYLAGVGGLFTVHNSGTGSWPVLLDAAREYAKSTNIEKPFGKHLGVIMSLPKRSEGSRVQRNAHVAITAALKRLELGHISSLVIVDNARIHELFPGLPVKQFWTVANRNFASILHTFNLLAAEDSEYNCLDEETEALTERGWVRGFDLDPKDVLLTKNADTGELEWQSMDDLKLFPDYEGDLVEFDHRTFSAVTTPDHRWLVTNYKGEDVCKVSDELSLHGHDRIHRAGWYAGATSQTWSDDFVELMGWFLTDGTCRVEERVREPSQPWVSAYVYQSQRANPEKVARIDALLDRLGCCAYRGEREQDGRVTWRLDGATSEVLHNLFPDKTLTSSVALRLTVSQAHRLVKAMMLGDGNLAGTDERQRVFTTGSKEEADAFQMLCMLTGEATTSRWRDMSDYKPRSDKLDNVPNMTGVWVTTILRRRTIQLQEKHKRTFHAKQGVWCPVVPNTYFVARRKGTVYITGNTFDRADFRSVVQNGLMVFGMTRVEQWQGKEDISKAMRQNLKGTLLADGFNLASADMAGAIVLAHDKILGEIPMENIDYAFHSLGRALGNESITLHNGIYESRGNVSMRVFTIISGLEAPEGRIEELEQLAR